MFTPKMSTENLASDRKFQGDVDEYIDGGIELTLSSFLLSQAQHVRALKSLQAADQ